jgi:hypothetical protein
MTTGENIKSEIITDALLLSAVAIILIVVSQFI